MEFQTAKKVVDKELKKIQAVAVSTGMKGTVIIKPKNVHWTVLDQVIEAISFPRVGNCVEIAEGMNVKIIAN